MNNQTQQTQELAEILSRGCAKAFVIAFAIICIGCALIPGVVAFLFGWAWLFAYPVLFVLLVIALPKKKK